MENSPEVSVTIPTYNQSRFIRDTLESVLNQTYTNLEVIVADDASTDGTREIIQEYARKDRRVKPLFSDKNQGIPTNFNRSFDACTGKYIAFLGGDDIMFPDKIARQVEFLENHPDYGLCMHDMELYDYDRDKLIMKQSDKGKFPKEGWQWGLSSNWFFRSKTIGVIPSTCLARSDYYLASRYRDDFKIKHEIIFSFENFARNPEMKWHTFPEILGRYNFHASNYSTGEGISDLIFEETERMIDLLRKKYPRYEKIFKNYIAFFYYKTLLLADLDTDSYNEVLKKFKQEARPWQKALFYIRKIKNG